MLYEVITKRLDAFKVYFTVRNLTAENNEPSFSTVVVFS